VGRFFVSIHVALNHVTHYRYDRLITLSPQIVRLRPAPHCRTRILAYSLRVEPAEHFVNWQQDPEANYLARVVFPEKTRELSITVDLVAEMAILNPFDFFLEPYAQQYPFVYEAGEQRELAPYLARVAPTPLLSGYLESIVRKNKSLIDWLVDLNMRLSRDVRYLIRMQPGVQTPEETLQEGCGSCRGLAVGTDPAPSRASGALRIRLSHPTHTRREVSRRTVRADRGFHRSARLVRGLSARRGLDRLRSNVRIAGGRRTHSARLHARAFGGSAGHGPRGGKRG
jgi:Bacterial transglutaminase-like N-terminal region